MLKKIPSKKGNFVKELILFKMEDSTIIKTTHSDNKSWLSVAKENIFVILSATVTTFIICSGFYYNTINYETNNSKDIFSLTEKVNEIEKTYKEPVVESRLNKQQLDDIQRQLDELKVTVNKTDNKLENKFEAVDNKFDKVFEILFTIQNNTKKK